MFQRIWLPGLLLQSVLIGGGYATGRELVEFFLTSGPVSGLLGMSVATVVFSIVCALSFELARMTRSYDYRSFFQQLLGRGWFVFELSYFVLGLLVLSVLGAAAGELAAAHLDMPKIAGIVILMALIGLLVFWGTALIERVLAAWSFVLYATYLIFLAYCLAQFGQNLAGGLPPEPAGSHWLGKGLMYAGYNVAAVPIILFCAKHLTCRRDAVTAGLLAGPLAMIPAALFYLAMATAYPAVLESPVPADFLMQRLDVSWLMPVFYIVVFGTLVETGTAFIHAVNQRIEPVFSRGRGAMPHWLRAAIAVAALLLAIVLAGRIGLIDLIAKGYGTLTWVFMAVFILPLCTLGLWKVLAGTAVHPSPDRTADPDKM